MIAITHTDLSNPANTAAAHDSGRLSDLSDGDLLASTRMLWFAGTLDSNAIEISIEPPEVMFEPPALPAASAPP